MKDKEKQIEEMANICCGSEISCSQCFKEYKNITGIKIKKRADHCQAYNYAENLYNAGYHKLTEDSVVLSRKEFDEFRKDQAEVKFLKRKIIEQARKETAEKILDEMFECINSFGVDYVDIREKLKEIATREGVEIKEDKNV